jgi:hypothetical protein
MPAQIEKRLAALEQSAETRMQEAALRAWKKLLAGEDALSPAEARGLTALLEFRPGLWAGVLRGLSEEELEQTERLAHALAGED